MSEEQIYPLTFDPVFRDYIWGGRNLEKLYGRELPPGLIPESWEISGHPSSPTTVNAGPLEGWTVLQVQEQLGEQLVGTRSKWATCRDRFPLLVKLLDAHRRLSVQVHPPDEYAFVHEACELGKAEMWYVLHAEPDARLIFGLAQRMDRESFRQALEGNALDGVLHHLPIRSGDAIMVPSGAVHALLGGCVVVEVQQNSDTTYRVYDWGRVGADGTPRPLHIQEALDVIDFEFVQPQAYPARVLVQEEGLCRTEIGSCPYFNVERVSLSAGAQVRGQCDGSTFEIWGCISGQSTLEWAGAPVRLPAIQFTLLPAALGEFSLRADRPATLLRAYAPE